MAHTTDHPIVDDEKLFSINTADRSIHHESEGKLLLVQGDHNSERFSFEIPLIIEGHNVMDCTNVEVHFINIDGDNNDRSSGVYEVDDLTIKEDDANSATFSWLISHAATELVGTLNFAIRFLCKNETRIEYSWNTLPYSGVIVSTGIDSSESLIADYTDIIASWYEEILTASDSVKNSAIQEIQETGNSAIQEIQETSNTAIQEIQETSNTAKSSALSEISAEVATFTEATVPHMENVLKQNLLDFGGNHTKKLYTIDGNEMRVFVGSEEEYQALSEDEKANLFAIITDDPSMDILNELKSRKVQIPRFLTYVKMSYKRELLEINTCFSYVTDTNMTGGTQDNIVLDSVTGADAYYAILNSMCEIMPIGTPIPASGWMIVRADDGVAGPGTGIDGANNIIYVQTAESTSSENPVKSLVIWFLRPTQDGFTSVSISSDVEDDDISFDVVSIPLTREV